MPTLTNIFSTYCHTNDNEEEKRVITGSEQITAKKHGEIKGNEVTRKNHNGVPYYTESPISTEPQNPITVTPNNE